MSTVSSQVGVALFPSFQHIFYHFTFPGFPFILVAYFSSLSKVMQVIFSIFLTFFVTCLGSFSQVVIAPIQPYTNADHAITCLISYFSPNYLFNFW